MSSSAKITEIYCCIDHFFKEFKPKFEKYLTGRGKTKEKVEPSLSKEIMLQVILHLNGFKNFNVFYLGYLCQFYGDKDYFSMEFFQSLFANGIHLVTKPGKNMYIKSITANDNILSVQTSHSQDYHRSIQMDLPNRTLHAQKPQEFQHQHYSVLIAYNFTESNPSLRNNLFNTKPRYLGL
jgi:hypothetical protein